MLENSLSSGEKDDFCEGQTLSVDDISLKDVSAAIDAVLRLTGQSSIFYVGHSQVHYLFFL